MGSERPCVFGPGLYGVLGSGGGGGPGAVFLHGWGGYRCGPGGLIVRLARKLQGRGVTTLRFDFRGRGDSPGNPEEATLDGMIEDACEAVGFLRRETGVRECVLVGICSGSNAAAGAADAAGVEGLALVSMPLFMEQKNRRTARDRSLRVLGGYLRKAVRPSTWKRLVTGRVNVKGVSKHIRGEAGDDEAENRRKTSSRDIPGEMARFRGRVIFIYGDLDPEADSAVPVFREILPRARFETIAGATHNFYAAAARDSLCGVLADWIGDGGTRLP